MAVHNVYGDLYYGSAIADVDGTDGTKVQTAESNVHELEIVSRARGRRRLDGAPLVPAHWGETWLLRLNLRGAESGSVALFLAAFGDGTGAKAGNLLPGRLAGTQEIILRPKKTGSASHRYLYGPAWARHDSSTARIVYGPPSQGPHLAGTLVLIATLGTDGEPVAVWDDQASVAALYAGLS